MPDSFGLSGRGSATLTTAATAGPLLSVHPPLPDGPAQNSSAYKALREKSPVIENDHVSGGRTGRTTIRGGARSSAALPIRLGEQITGVLHVGSRKPGFFDDAKLKLLNSMTKPLGAMINNARLRESAELEKALRARRDTFISIASHELRTPMTALMGLSEILTTRDVDSSTSDKYLRTIYAESKRLTAILDDLLDVSRIESGTLKLNLQQLSLQDLAAQVIQQVKPSLGKHSIALECEEDVPPVLADGSKVHQILWNLIDNAVKYSSDGGAVAVKIAYQPKDARVVVSVADQGVGIAPSDRRKLFGSFHRIRNDETTSIRGTGLGLYIVKSLVDVMDGEVWLRSKRRVGSTFYVSFPIYEMSKEAAA